MDSFTEVSSRSWISRLMGSFKSVLFGIIIFILSLVLLFWNEGRAVKTAKGLKEGRGAVVAANLNSLNPEFDGKLLYLSGKVETKDTLSDEQFNIRTNSLKLKRTVEMYQWVEESDTDTQKKFGGGEKTKTTYTYTKQWSENLHKSKNFKRTEGHLNPLEMPLRTNEQSVKKANVGAYSLSEALIYKLFQHEPINIPTIDTTKIKHAKLINDGVNDMVYIGQGTNEAPEVGDMRVRFSVIPQADYSIVAQQVNNVLDYFETSYGTNILDIRKGQLTEDEMFTAAERDNVFVTWLLRFIGWFMVFLALVSIFKPLLVMIDVLPIIGNLLGFGITIFAGAFSTVITFITIAIAWLFFRPLLAISLVLIAIFVVVGFYLKAKKRKENQLV